MNKEELNLNALKCFYVVAQCGSLSKASKLLYTSQPCVSCSIKQLENYYNVKLFQREHGGMKLTVIGDKILEKVCLAYNFVEECQEMAEKYNKLENGEIEIGIHSYVYSLIENQLVEFLNSYPKIKVSFYDEPSVKMLEELSNSELDYIIDIGPLEIKDTSLECEKITNLEMCFAVSYINEKSDKEMSLFDLKDETIITPESNTGIKKVLDDNLKKYGLEVKAKIEATNNITLISLIKNNLGVGYTFKNLLNSLVQEKQIKILNIKEKLDDLSLCCVYKQRDNPIINKLSEILLKKGNGYDRKF